MSWLGPSCASRIHKNAFTRLGVDEEPATQVNYNHTAVAVNAVVDLNETKCNCVCNQQAPDWNEELQAARDLPVSSLEERLQRDRTMLQVAQY